MVMPQWMAGLLLLHCLVHTGVAQTITLHSVHVSTVYDPSSGANKNRLRVSYSTASDFGTCLHMYSGAQAQHVMNWFCQHGPNTVVNIDLSGMIAGFGVGTVVELRHGNNGNIRSGQKTVKSFFTEPSFDSVTNTGLTVYGTAESRCVIGNSCPPSGKLQTRVYMMAVLSPSSPPSVAQISNIQNPTDSNGNAPVAYRVADFRGRHGQGFSSLTPGTTYDIWMFAQHVGSKPADFPALWALEQPLLLTATTTGVAPTTTLPPPEIILHSVGITTNGGTNVVEIEYSSFNLDPPNICLHLRLTDANGNAFGESVTVYNFWCSHGSNVQSVVPLSSFKNIFVAGAYVRFHHGNNAGIRSNPVQVT